jgi:hypothetical protein
MDVDAACDSMRVLDRSAWESTHPGEPLATYIPGTQIKWTSTKSAQIGGVERAHYIAGCHVW